MEDSMDEPDDLVSLEEIFKSAANCVRQIGSKFDAEKLLYFYARYKQVNDGPCTIPKPGFFDFHGKQKWDAWKNLGDMGKTEAMMEYISLLENIEPGWRKKTGYGPVDTCQTKDSNRSGMGVFVSTMVCADEELSDQQKTIFHWCQEGDVSKVKALLSSAEYEVNQLDSEGMGLLHWASDRGLEDMVTMLLKHGADVNLQDSDGQTAMHYAVSCEHESIIWLLKSWQADLRIKDSLGNTPADIASSNMKMLLDNVALNVV